MQAKDQTLEPATRQRDSVERAEERRMERSRRRESCVSRSVCLCEPSVKCEGFYLWRGQNKKRQGLWCTYRPTSKLGAAMGDSSVVMVKIPSNFRSGLGAAMEAETRARALS